MQSPVLERLVGGAVLVGLLLLLALAIGPRNGLHMPDKGDLTVSMAEDAPEPAASELASFPAEPDNSNGQLEPLEWTSPDPAPASERAALASSEPAPSISSPDSVVTSVAAGRWAVQVGNFRVRAYADRLSDWCREQGYGVRVLRHTRGNQTEYRVRVGPYVSRAEAETARAELALRNRDGYVAGWEDGSP